MAVSVRNKTELLAALNQAFAVALSGDVIKLPHEVGMSVVRFSEKVADQATAALTNLLTCLVAAAADPNCDPRYHRKQSEVMPAPPDGRVHFSGRGISEEIVYPWLAERELRGAMSGWQTRVFERQAHYTMTYAENISQVRDEFLSILDAVANRRVAAASVLALLLRMEVNERAQRESLRQSVIQVGPSGELQIHEVLSLLGEQFALPQSSRLPVLAIQAIYSCIVPSVARFDGMTVLPLSEHSAADEHTGSVGDVEIARKDGSIFEALEVKHGIKISDVIVKRSFDKIWGKQLDRYYILSTSEPHKLTSFGESLIIRAREELGCQIVVNGVEATVRYFLRLLKDTRDFVQAYGDLLISDRRVGKLHMIRWSEGVAALQGQGAQALAAEDGPGR